MGMNKNREANMHDAALIQLVRELDQLKKEVEDLQAALQPVFAREERLQREEEYNRKYPYGWWYKDETKTEIYTG